eukprot:m.57147 g.57147  ORF g.57147 m.57147 type:complete len:200 (+) comp11588_c0_seq3:1490-2089(+)
MHTYALRFSLCFFQAIFFFSRHFTHRHALVSSLQNVHQSSPKLCLCFAPPKTTLGFDLQSGNAVWVVDTCMLVIHSTSECEKLHEQVSCSHALQLAAAVLTKVVSCVACVRLQKEEPITTFTRLSCLLPLSSFQPSEASPLTYAISLLQSLVHLHLNQNSLRLVDNPAQRFTAPLVVESLKPITQALFGCSKQCSLTSS